MIVTKEALICTRRSTDYWIKHGAMVANELWDDLPIMAGHDRVGTARNLRYDLCGLVATVTIRSQYAHKTLFLIPTAVSDVRATVVRVFRYQEACKQFDREKKWTSTR